MRAIATAAGAAILLLLSTPPVASAEGSPAANSEALVERMFLELDQIARLAGACDRLLGGKLEPILAKAGERRPVELRNLVMAAFNEGRATAPPGLTAEGCRVMLKAQLVRAETVLREAEPALAPPPPPRD